MIEFTSPKPSALELECPCGGKMRPAEAQPLRDTIAQVQIYFCGGCQREFRLTVWQDLQPEDV